MSKQEIKALSFIDVQHDAMAVFDDVSQHTVQAENVWVSAVSGSARSTDGQYQEHAQSVHGKMRIERDDGEVRIECTGGVKVERSGNTLSVSIPSLKIEGRPVQFPAQILGEKSLHINAIDYSAKSGLLALGGEDGYAAVLDPSSGQETPLKGHVGDVLDVKWFPSGEVVLTASSDLTIRVYSAKDGVNPRTLKGHTRGITALHIVGVGKEVLSASKDGTVRLWNVGEGKEIRKWTASQPIEGMIAVPGQSFQAQGEVILTASPDGTITAFNFDSPEPLLSLQSGVASKLSSLAYSPALDLVATGHANGVIALRPLSSLSSPPTLLRRNESTILSLAFDSTSLLVGTASGLPARLNITNSNSQITAQIAEEYAGWEAVAVESWAVGPGDVYCAGTEGGIRRYKS